MSCDSRMFITSDFSIHQPSAIAVIVQFSYVVIIAPIVEEFIYRGAILTALSPYGRGAAVLFSALAFGLMHGNIACGNCHSVLTKYTREDRYEL